MLFPSRSVHPLVACAILLCLISVTEAAPAHPLQGKKVILSVADKQVNFNQLSRARRLDESVLRLVSPADVEQAFRDNGYRSGNPLQIDNPARSMTESLTETMRQRFQWRVIGRGRLPDIDPVALQQSLPQGELVSDARLSVLRIQRVGDNLYTLEGGFQFSLIDLRAGQLVMRTQCNLDNSHQPQPIQFYAAGRGINISRVLHRFADRCLTQLGSQLSQAD